MLNTIEIKKSYNLSTIKIKEKQFNLMAWQYKYMANKYRLGTLRVPKVPYIMETMTQREAVSFA